MIGAIIGDIVGSAYQFQGMKRKDFDFFPKEATFTDDSVMSIAIADAILHKKGYVFAIKEWGQKYPDVGYASMFREWVLSDDMKPYGSFGNGSAMRVSSIGFAFNTIEDVLNEARKTAEVTHNHPEGIKGAQSVASAIFLAKTGKSKHEIKNFVVQNFGYDLSRTIDQIRPSYSFRVTCQESVPESIIAFLESNDYEDAVRKAISLGGDADTMACITGGIAQAYYKKIPDYISQRAMEFLQDDFITILKEFDSRFGCI